MTARSEQGQFASLGSGAVGGSSSVYKEPALEARSDGSGARPIEHGSMQNMLKHIEQLESKLTVNEKALLEAQTKAEKFSARTREGMQSALDTLMQKWMDAVETKDATYKEEFKRGMKGLVDKSAEENGVWQMMVAASALHPTFTQVTRVWWRGQPYVDGAFAKCAPDHMFDDAAAGGRGSTLFVQVVPIERHAETFPSTPGHVPSLHLRIPAREGRGEERPHASDLVDIGRLWARAWWLGYYGKSKSSLYRHAHE